jgi:hypothetical protein
VLNYVRDEIDEERSREALLYLLQSWEDDYGDGVFPPDGWRELLDVSDCLDPEIMRCIRKLHPDGGANRCIAALWNRATDAEANEAIDKFVESFENGKNQR